MNISDRVPPFFKTATLFYQPSLLPPFALLYIGGEFQLLTRLLISFNHNFNL